MAGLRHAFKEWAIICRALAEGRQALILRKGGIAETDGTFRVEHQRFWLYPTYVHQQQTGVVPEAASLLERVEAERPAPGVVRLTHLVEVADVHRVTELATALRLEGLHVWSPDVVRQRFAYREPGLFVLTARVFQATPVELSETPAYAGCRSWVVLERELPSEGVPVLDDAAFKAIREETYRRIA
jgi:hypothetical protein